MQAWGSLLHSGIVDWKKEWRCWVELVGKCLKFRLWLLLVLESLSIMSSTWTATFPFIIKINMESLASLRLSLMQANQMLQHTGILDIRSKSWVVQQAALHCTASRLLICFFRWGSQIATAYSRRDLMNDICALSRNLMGQQARLRCNSPTVLLHELVTCYICLAHSISQLNNTPKYLVSLAWLRIAPHQKCSWGLRSFMLPYV